MNKLWLKALEITAEQFKKLGPLGANLIFWDASIQTKQNYQKLLKDVANEDLRSRK